MENLIGRKIKGFEVEGYQFKSEMKKYIGKIGFIEDITVYMVRVRFENNECWCYPIHQIQPHLIPLEKQDKKMYSLEELKNNKNIIIEFKSPQDWTYAIRLTKKKSAFAKAERELYSLYHDSFLFPSDLCEVSLSIIRITIDQIKEFNIISKNEENGKSRELPESSSKDEPRSNRGRVIVRCGGQQVTNAIRLEGDKQSSNTSKTRIVKNENIKGVRLK